MNAGIGPELRADLHHIGQMLALLALIDDESAAGPEGRSRLVELGAAIETFRGHLIARRARLDELIASAEELETSAAMQVAAYDATDRRTLAPGEWTAIVQRLRAAR